MFEQRGAATRQKRLLAVAAVIALGAVSCGTSNSGGGTPGASGASAASGAPNKTFTVGVLTDLTGLAASSARTSVDGVKAGTFYASRHGYTIKYVVADTQSNPTTTLAAAQKLVRQDHVGAVLAVSSLLQLASNYLTQRNIPVIGAAQDGPEWLTSKNMFSVFGPSDTTRVATTFGSLMKLLGATTIGSLGYGVSPVSAQAAEGNAASATAAGLKVGYINANLPFGSTNVAPVAIEMKNAHVDGVFSATTPSTAFSLVSALKPLGVNVRATVLAAGFGSDLLQGGSGGINAAQGVVWMAPAEPFAMKTAATTAFAGDLSSAGVKVSQATYAQYMGYMSVGLLIRGLDRAGANPTNSSLINALGGIHDWDGVGLFGAQRVDLSSRIGSVAGPKNCTWGMRLNGKEFVLVQGAEPLCGALIPGKRVAPGT